METKKSKKTLIKSVVLATLLVGAIVFGTTSNFFGSLEELGSKSGGGGAALTVSLASTPISDTVMKGGNIC